jgi:hypothetical protein
MNQGIYVLVRERMAEQDKTYGPFASTQEALGVCLEEWNELQEAIKTNDLDAVQRECLDLAAPLLRLAEQLFKDQGLRRRSRKAEQ